eukprot:scaffold24.g2952.t1
MEAALRRREAGAVAAFGLADTAAADAGLARRLQEVAQLAGHAGSVDALGWSECRGLLVTGGEDCRLRLWRPESGELVHAFDSASCGPQGTGVAVAADARRGADGCALRAVCLRPPRWCPQRAAAAMPPLLQGHTSSILGAMFLPASDGNQVVSCSADKQVRLLNVVRGASRPYSLHKGRVRSLVALDPHVFLSASEDGTVRETDVRVRPPPVHRGADHGHGQPADDANVLIDQRAERLGRARARVGIYSLAVDEARPWLMLTGGTDPLARLYDRRMLSTPADAGARGRTPAWARAYIPAHLKAVLWDGRPGGGGGGAGGAAPAPASYQIPAVVFGRGGAEVVASYSGDFVYSFDAVDHGRDAESLASGGAPPQAAHARAPVRPRSQTGRRSMHAWTPPEQQQQQGGSPVGGVTGAAPGQPDDGATGREGSQAAMAAAAMAAQAALQLRRQQAARGMGIAASLRQLEEQRRQLGRAPPPPPARAESSRPGHRQVHPTSSTLRSPWHALRRPGEQPVSLLQADSESEGSEGKPHAADGQPQQHAQQQQAVRRSRRIRQRRREAEQAQEAEAEQEALAAAAAAGAFTGVAPSAGAPSSQAAAVSGIAEQPGRDGSEKEDEIMLSPTRRRVRRRLAASAADEAVARPLQQLGHAPASPTRGPHGTSGQGPPGGGEFKQPEGRAPGDRRQQPAAQRHQRQQAHAQRLDSTLGLLQHPASVLDTSEVGAGQGAAHARRQEPTVSMEAQGPPPPGGSGVARQRSPVAEVTSRPPAPPSASLILGVGLTQQGSLQMGGHEASSLNSAEQPAGERVESVAHRPPAEAPSVGNAPHNAGTAGGTVQQPAPEAPEASTGHMRNLGQAPGAATLQQQLAQRQRQGPAASTGASHPLRFGGRRGQPAPPGAGAGVGPPAAAPLPTAHASGRLASRLRRYAAAVSGAAGAVVGGAGEAGEAAGPSLLQTQGTMLSGRGPSLIGDFMPGAPQGADSEIEQQHGRADEGSGPRTRGAEAPAALPPPHEARPRHQQQQQEQAGQRWRRAEGPVDSNVGVIVNNADADGGEEVTEPTMYRRCYAGHLNLMLPTGVGGLAATPPLALLGRGAAQLLAAPSDDGSLFVWDYSTGRLLNVLAASPGSPATCVAPHPAAPGLASGGADGIVRLWSPEAAAARDIAGPAAAVEANARALLAHEPQAALPPPGLGLGLGPLDGSRTIRGADGQQMRCQIM